MSVSCLNNVRLLTFKGQLASSLHRQDSVLEVVVSELLRGKISALIFITSDVNGRYE